MKKRVRPRSLGFPATTPQESRARSLRGAQTRSRIGPKGYDPATRKSWARGFKPSQPPALPPKQATVEKGPNWPEDLDRLCEEQERDESAR